MAKIAAGCLYRRARECDTPLLSCSFHNLPAMAVSLVNYSNRNHACISIKTYSRTVFLGRQNRTTFCL